MVLLSRNLANHTSLLNHNSVLRCSAVVRHRFPTDCARRGKPHLPRTASVLRRSFQKRGALSISILIFDKAVSLNHFLKSHVAPVFVFTPDQVRFCECLVPPIDTSVMTDRSKLFS